MKKKSRRTKRILVIDDNAGILFCMREALQLEKCEVQTSESFLGIEDIVHRGPDMIYLDISLVGQDGRKISKEIKSDPRTKNIPIVILTAYPNARELAREAGANDFLPKPFDLDDLWKMTAKFTS